MTSKPAGRFPVGLAIAVTVAVIVAVLVLWGDPFSQQLDGPDHQTSDSSPEFGPYNPDEYVGSKACEECHNDKWTDYQSSGHARTFHSAGDGAFAETWSGKSFKDPERDYTFRYQLSGTLFSATAPEVFGNNDPFPFEYQLGSGDHAATLMTLIPSGRSGTVGVEHRLTSVTGQQTLALTPGHVGLARTGDVDVFGRIIRGENLERCFRCHTTTCEIRAERLWNLRPNVGCEVCHGPGSAHVAATSRSDDKGKSLPHDALHINRYSGDVEIRLCGTCHRAIDAESSPAVSRENWRLVRFQPVGLVQSKCYLQSRSKLSCSTCHNPHQHASQRSRQEYEQICLSCHTRSQQRPEGSQSTPQTACPVSPAQNCVECHMPPVEVYEGIAFHDHWIRIRGADDPAPYDGAPRKHGGLTKSPVSTNQRSIPPASDRGNTVEASRLQFRDVASEVNFDFRHHSPLTPERHLHLVMGSGIGWIDFDGDNWPDLFCAQGASFGDSADSGFPDSLFRNIGGLSFQTVTAETGVGDTGYSMGLAVGDFNNDGFPDLYVTHYGPNRCYVNNGDGTFTETAAALKLDDGRYGAGVSWVDLDQDGDLDLFAVNYTQLNPGNYPLCEEEYQGQKYSVTCPPRGLAGEPDIIWRNNGDGTFLDISSELSLNDSPARQGLGIAAADFDEDGRVDVYVANDSVPNQLWMNHGDGVLTEQGLVSGTALNRSGRREAGMGVAVGDLDGDGLFDLFVTNYYGESNTLYRNEGDGLFLDITDEFGLAGPSLTRLGFGASLLDADSDGWLDLFVANGHVHDRLPEMGRDEPFAQLPSLFINDQGRQMRDISTNAGACFRQPVVGRGSAAGDFDRDGRPDLAVLHLNGQAALLRNESASGHTLELRLVGTHCNRDAIGAVITVELPDRRLVRLRHGSTSYLSTDDGRILVGIGNAETAQSVIVRWPGGDQERWANLPINQPHVLIEGTAASKPY